MGTRHRRPRAGTRNRDQGRIDGRPLVPDQPPTASESAFVYPSASEGGFSTGPSAGSQRIVDGASGDMPSSQSVWADTGWFVENGRPVRVRVLTCAWWRLLGPDS